MTNIKASTRSGLKWTFSSTIFRAGINFLNLLFLTYALGKENLGLISILTVIFGLSETLVQFGVSQSIIRRQDISHSELSSIFWFNIGIGVLIFFAVFVLARPIAGFYNEPDLFVYTEILAIIFLIMPFELIFRALLEKELLFALTEKINIAKSLTLLITTVVLVRMELGVVGYVYAMLISTCISSLLFLLYFAKSEIWFPTLHFKLDDLRAHAHFGFYVTAKAFITYFGRNFDELIIGKVLGLEMLGVYFFAKRAVETPRIMFTNSLGKVAFPIFSKLKTELSELQCTYFSLTNFVAVFGFCVFGLLLVVSPSVIPLVLGAAWSSEVTLIQIFCLISIVSLAFVDTFSSSLLYIYDKQRYVSGVDLVFTPIRLALVYFTALISIEMVAVSFLLIVLLKSLILQNEVNKYLALSFRQYCSQLSLALSCLLPASATAFICTYHVSHNIYSAVVATFSFIASYGLVFMYIRYLKPDLLSGLSLINKK